MLPLILIIIIIIQDGHFGSRSVSMFAVLQLLPTNKEPVLDLFCFPRTFLADET